MNQDPVDTASIAPYAVVRMTLLAPLPEPELARRYRASSADLVDRLRWCAENAPLVGDLLHDLAGDTDSEVLRRQVLLPLRRDVHNGRSPRPALRAALAALPDPPPLLSRWLAVRDEIDAGMALLTSLAPAVLTAERAVLAELCRAESLRRAVASTSRHLLHAVCRAAEQGAHPDDRSRKSEPNVLRYALRATTDASPLSWFTQIGWGVWADVDDAADAWPGPVDTPVGIPSRPPVATAQPDRGSVDLLLSALMSRPGLRVRLAHRFAPGLRNDGHQIRFRRPVPADDPKAVDHEEEVTLPLTGPLRLVLERAGTGGLIIPRSLAEMIGTRLPGAPAEALATAERYVAGLLNVGLLRACYPMDPQTNEVLDALTTWLTGLELAAAGPARPASADTGGAGVVRPLIAILDDIGRRTRAFSQQPAVRRPGELERLRHRWDEAFTLLGAEPPVRRTPLTEDVTAADALRLDAGYGLPARDDLARLTPLFEIFDRYPLVRRIARDRFVARFGVGGRCPDIAEFGTEYSEIWRLPEVSDTDGSRAAEYTTGPEVRRLLRLRAELARLAADGHPAASPGGAAANGELVLAQRVVSEAARQRPAWLLRRPTSYAVFAQPVPGGIGAPGTIGLCVNAVSAGWGRYTSRFLDAFDPAAAAAVAAQIRAGAGPDARLAQLRPVAGFNANLHPLLVDREVCDDPAWGTTHPRDLHLVHDPASDQLRLQLAATGELVDLLYLGFLLPLALPDRMMPLVTDLGSGMVGYARALAPQTRRPTPVGVVTFRPRLRYRDVLLCRARWQLTPAIVEAWRADLAAEQGPPVLAAARWRGLLGLPEKVVVAPGHTDDAAQLAALLAPAEQARPQYVDFGSVLHVRHLARLLARYPDGIALEEAVPAPTAGRHTVEIVTETYRRAR